MYNRIFSKAFDNIKEKSPLIHCITNPISINDCANFVLALGAKPIMAEHPREVEEITATADALAVNIANITDARMESIKLSLKTANAHNIPCIMDIVGINCSKLRYNYVTEVLKDSSVSILKGNMSEIKALCNKDTHGKGIDACGDSTDSNNLKENAAIARELAIKYNCTVLASGKIDIIADKEHIYAVENGCEAMSLITGTGCILNVITGTFLAVEKPVFAAVMGAAVLGIAGETADSTKGNGTFRIQLLDKVSTITPSIIKERAVIRCIE